MKLNLNPEYIISPSYSITYAEKYFKDCDMILISKKRKLESTPLENLFHMDHIMMINF